MPRRATSPVECSRASFGPQTSRSKVTPRKAAGAGSKAAGAWKSRDSQWLEELIQLVGGMPLLR